MSQATASRPIERIREETRDEHERTERAVERRFFASGLTDRDGYVELLAAFLAVYRPLEERLAPAADRHLPSFRVRRRTRRLESDLLSLGLSEAQIDALPTVPPDCLPDLRDASAVLGCLYVVEGSQLGHRVLWKRVRGTLDPGAADADAFLGPPADRVRTRWEAFGDLFDRRMSPDDDLSTAVATARTTFRAYRRGLA
jgi:heme oxygenase